VLLVAEKELSAFCMIQDLKIKIKKIRLMTIKPKHVSLFGIKNYVN
jgi:hypothetical protein